MAAPLVELPLMRQGVLLVCAIAVIVLCTYGLVRLHVRQWLKDTKIDRPASGPVIVLAIALTVLGECIYGLSILGLLRPMVEGEPFQVVLFVLASAAIIFAWIQFWDSRRHGSKIEQMVGSISTRFIGVFPKDIDDIIDVVQLADREILIMTDFIDYGSYSRPDKCDELLKALTHASEEKVAIRCLVYGDGPANETLNTQFRAEEFRKTSKSPSFSYYFDKKYRGRQKPTTHRELLDVLVEKQKECTKELLDKGLQIQTLSEKVWLYFWLEDEEDAVFVFEDIGTKDLGLAFRTRDAKLIETFKGIFERKWNPSLEKAAARVAAPSA